MIFILWIRMLTGVLIASSKYLLLLKFTIYVTIVFTLRLPTVFVIPRRWPFLQTFLTGQYFLTCTRLCTLQYVSQEFICPYTRSILLSMQHCTIYWSCMSDIDAKILCKSIDINNIVSIKLIVYGLLIEYRTSIWTGLQYE